MRTMQAGTMKRKGLEGLALLDFPVKTQPVYLAGGKEIDGHKAVVRTDTGQTMGLVTDQYELVPYQAGYTPYLERLGRHGWDVNEVRLERNGSRSYVELHNRDGAMAVKVGDPVGRRLLISNSYDGTTSVRMQGGFFVLVCLNGATRPDGNQQSFSLRHTGGVFENIDNAADSISHELETTIEMYRGLAEQSVSKEIANAVIQEVCGLRKLDIVTAHWTRRGHAGSTAQTAWNLYNAITYYLTHEFGGAVAARELKNRETIDLLVSPEKVKLLIEQQRREKALSN